MEFMDLIILWHSQYSLGSNNLEGYIFMIALHFSILVPGIVLSFISCVNI